MGLFTWPFEIGNLSGDNFEWVEGLVDTGATYSLVAADTLYRLGVEPTETIEFDLADGSTIERKVGDARARVEGKEVITAVIFGEEGDSALLGVYTLERTGLAVDPHGRHLIPVRASLKPVSQYSDWDARLDR